MEGAQVVVGLFLLVGVCMGQFVRLNDEQRLTNRLLSITKKTGVYARPVVNVSETLPASFGIALIKVLNFKEKDANLATIKLLTWHRYTWYNYQLQWDPADFGGLETVRIPVNKMWKPDIKLFNGLDVTPQEDNDALAVISHEGNVLWIPPAVDEVSCLKDIDSNQWICQLKYGSWTYDGFKLSLDFYSDLQGFDMNDYITSSQLEIQEQSGRKNIVYYPCCVEPYVDLTFTLKLSER